MFGGARALTFLRRCNPELVCYSMQRSLKQQEHLPIQSQAVDEERYFEIDVYRRIRLRQADQVFRFCRIMPAWL